MREIRNKRLIHRANYRGFREADLILGGFAKAYARDLSDEEFDQLETLLEEKDHDIYDWINGTQKLPDAFDTPLFAKLCAYTPKI